MNDKDGNEPGRGIPSTHNNPTSRLPTPSGLMNSVAPELCASYRAHLETKIEDMETNIKSAVYLAGFIMTAVQLALYFFR